MFKNFFSDTTDTHWQRTGVHESLAQGAVSSNFRGMEQFFHGWRAILLVVFGVMIVAVFLDDALQNGMSVRHVAGLSPFVLFYYFYYRLWHEEQKSLHFLVWLSKNRDRLQKGETLVYEQHALSLHTPVRQFETCFSFVLLTSLFSSRYLFEHKDSAAFTGFIYTIFALLFGWWGIPWGFVYTVKSVVNNITGGHKKTIQALMREMDTLAAHR